MAAKINTLSMLHSQVDAQAFLPAADGAVLTLGYPDSLSLACQDTFNQSTQCNATLGAVTFSGLFPSADQLSEICTNNCFQSLQSFRTHQRQVCGEESYHLDGQLVPATYGVDQLHFTYNYTCLQDPSTKQYCARLSCSYCMLRTFQVHLNSPFEYDDKFARYYSSLTSSLPITSPPPYTVPGPPTTASSSMPPARSCASEYLVQEGDDCLSVSKAQSVSTAMLRYLNGITADCSNFPEPGNSLCMPATCHLHTLRANETCFNIMRVHGWIFTMTQLISWNPNINGQCSNLEVMTGTQLCISPPGDTEYPGPNDTITTIAELMPAPSNVINGTNLRCARYYEVAPADTYASIAVMMRISLRDFYFLNPEFDNPNCTNLMAGFFFCVQAFGDIDTYPGYAPHPNPCFNHPIPASCLATGPFTTAPYWEWPIYTTTRTQTTSLPLASGSLENCAAYAYHITSRRNSTSMNSCYVVANFYDQDVHDFVLWNPSLSYNPDDPAACQLQPGYSYCARLSYPSAPATTPASEVTSMQTSTSIGSTTFTTTRGTSTTTSTASNTTPTPTQKGMGSRCRTFYRVSSGDGCYDIATRHGITLEQVYAYNPAVDADCSGLWLDYYVCVGV
ncbi:hypothetical protein BJY01DRAFT_257326 [Aspergillus pseudoustus]|uniref:LysM domain-containing protein n=1 Tax=Aspergillus pseudoustus TaxID=1810923 RepID=A0ABR4KRK5_9EURO